jgi:hypothetical protein
MNKKTTNEQSDLFPKYTLFLSGISFLADIIALGQVTYTIIAKDQLENIALQLVAIVLFFLLGVGLGAFGLRGFKRDSVETALQIYVWAYLLLACLSYMGVITIWRQPYSLSTYFACFIIITLQLTAFYVLRSASQVKPAVSHALALLTVSVLHGLIFLYYLLFVEIPPLIYVIGELFFWICWTLSAAPMIRSALDATGFHPRLQKR